MAGEAEAGPVTLTGTGDMSDMNRAVEGSISQLFSLEGAILATSAALGFLATKAIANSIKAMAEFETAMAGVQKVTGFTDERMTEIGEDARDIAIQFGISAEKVGEFQEAAARAGVRGTQEINKFAETVAKMDIALDGLDGDQVADQFARLIGFLGLTADESETVASTINALANQMPTDAGRIIDATSRMAADFRSLGLTADEILGLSAATSTLRESSNRAATRLRRVAQEMMSPAQLEEIGALFGTTGEKLAQLRRQAPIGLMMALAQVLNSNTRQAGQLADVLGVRVVSELRNVGLRSGRVKEALEIANDEFGRTQSINEEVAIFLDTLNKKWDSFQQTIHDTAIEIGQFFKPAVLGIIGVISGLAEDFRELNLATNGAVGAFVLATGAILSAAIAVSSFASIFRVTFGQSVKEALGRIGRLAGRIAILVGAVVILGQAWNDNWFGIRDTTKDVFNALSPVFEGIRQGFGLIGDALGSLDDVTGGTVTQIGKAVGLFGSLAVVGSFLFRVLKPIASTLLNFATKVGPKVRGFFSLLRNDIRNAIRIFSKLGGARGILTRLIGIFSRVGSVVSRFAGPIGFVIALASILWLAWRDNIDNFRTFIKTNLKEISNLFNRHFGEVVNQAQKTFEVWEKLTVQFLASLLVVIGPPLRAFQKAFDVALGAVTRLWELFGDNIVSVLKFFFDAIFTILEIFIDGFLTGLKSFFALLRGDWKAAFGFMKGFLERTFNRILSFIAEWVLGFRQGIDDVIEDIKTIFKEFGNWIIGNSFIQDTFNAITNWIRNVFKPDILGVIGNIVSDIKDEVEEGLNSLSKLGQTNGGGGGGAGDSRSPPGTDNGLPSGFGEDPLGLKDTPGLPILQSGGLITKTGLAFLHKGESVIPTADAQMGAPKSGTVVKIGNISINANSREEGRAAARGLSEELISNGVLPR